MKDIEAKVREIIEDRLGVEPKEIHLESSFTDDLGADSLDVVELIMAFEEEFEITIDDNKMDEIKTVKQSIDLVKSLVE